MNGRILPLQQSPGAQGVERAFDSYQIGGAELSTDFLPIQPPIKTQSQKEGFLQAFIAAHRLAPIYGGMSILQASQIRLELWMVGITRASVEGVAPYSEAQNRFALPIL